MLQAMGYREAPSSIGQRLLWFLEHYRPDTASLNCPVVTKLHGPLIADELQVALGRLAHRHEALRTTLVRKGRNLVQHVHDELRLPFHHIELPATEPDQLDGLLEEVIAKELNTPVEVGQYPMRVTLWRIDEGEHVLCLNMHHLVSDAWSCGIVLQDLIKFLEAGPDGDPGLPQVAWQYADFAQWQHEQMTSGALKKHQDYWIGQLKDMKLVALPPASAATGVRATGIETMAIEAGVFNRLKAIARSERTTPFAVMLTLYYLLLAQKTGQTDLSVASLFANRSVKGVQTTVGFFANMVVLRSQIDTQARFIDVVRSVRGTVIDGFLHEGIPYQMLPLNFQNSGGRVDDVVFQMLLTPPPGTKVSARGVEFELYTPDSLGSRFGLELGLIPQHTGDCSAMLFYTTDRFRPEWAKEFIGDYLAFAQAASKQPDIVLSLRKEA